MKLSLVTIIRTIHNTICLISCCTGSPGLNRAEGCRQRQMCIMDGFHDPQVREREFGVWRYLAELCGQYDAHLEFEQSNGLGVIQIGKPIDQSPLWLRPGSDEQRLIREYFQSLGRSMLECYSARELPARVPFLVTEIIALKAWHATHGLALPHKHSSWSNLRQQT